MNYHTVYAVLRSSMLRICISSHIYNGIIGIYLTSYIHLKLVNWNFINNQVNGLIAFGLQHYLIHIIQLLLTQDVYFGREYNSNTT